MTTLEVEMFFISKLYYAYPRTISGIDNEQSL